MAICGLIMAFALGGCGSSSSGSSVEPGTTLESFLTDGDDNELYKFEHEAVRFESTDGSATLVLPRRAWFEGQELPGWGITDQQVDDFLTTLNISPKQLYDALYDYEMDLAAFMFMFNGYSGSWTDVLEILALVAKDPDGVDNVAQFSYFLSDTDNNIESFELLLGLFDYTFASFMEYLDNYEVSFNELLELYLMSEAETLMDFFTITELAAADKISKDSGDSMFHVVGNVMNFYPNNQFTSNNRFYIVNSQDQNPVNYMNQNSATVQNKLRRQQGVDFQEIKFNLTMLYQMRNQNVAGDYFLGNVSNFEESHHGGFGLLEFSGSMGMVYNVGTATSPSPETHLVIRLKNKWWNYVIMQSLSYKLNGLNPPEVQ